MTKYLLSALLFATNAVAQQCSGTLTITASADVSALASCKTYSGSVVIPTGLSVPKDENGHQKLELTVVEKITGNLTITSIDVLTELHMDSIKSLAGMELASLTQLNTLSINQLQSVDQLNWSALPALQSWSGSGLTTASSILITNTGLAALDGLANLETVDYFNINNNLALTNISLKVTEIGKSLDIEANDGFSSGLSTSFPMLETAQNMTFQNCSEVLLPALKNVTDTLGFYGNNFKSFTAPKLTTAGGVVFVNNTDLTNVSLPLITTINGTCQISSNPELKKIDGFPQLSIVTGAVDFSGNFTDVELKKLTQVQGAFNIRTSENFDCSGFDSDHDDKKIRGTYTCKGQTSSESGSGSDSGTSTSTSTGAGSTSTKGSAAASFDFNLRLVVGGSSFVALLLHSLL